MPFRKMVERCFGRRWAEAQRPIEIISVETARSCNLACVQCGHHAKQIHERLDSQSLTTGLMTLTTFANILPILDWSAHLNLDLHGEPLLNEQIEEMIRLAKAAAPHLNVTLTSNFTRMNPQRAESLLNSGLTGIQVSIAGAARETHERIMIGSGFERLLANLRAFAEARRRLPNVLKSFSACVTLMRSNVEELVHLPPLLSRFGIDVIRVNNVLPYYPEMLSESLFEGPGWPRRWQQARAETVAQARRHKVQIYFASREDQILACRMPLRSFSVTYDGEVCPCFMLDTRGGSDFFFRGETHRLPYIRFGNVNCGNIRQIWNSEEFRIYRKRFETGQHPSYCKPCPVGRGLICG
jgi:MoaA/NifB/PqqE/SkfB family radical SAM enzyme